MVDWFFVLAVRNISIVCTSCEGPKSYNFTRSFENSLNPCNVCVRLCKPLNLGQGMKFAHCLCCKYPTCMHYIKLKNKNKYYMNSYSKVFLHRDNPWFWSKLWSFFFLRFRASKPTNSEYLRRLPNIISRSILTNKTEKENSNFLTKIIGCPFVIPDVAPCKKDV